LKWAAQTEHTTKYAKSVGYALLDDLEQRLAAFNEIDIRGERMEWNTKDSNLVDELQ